MKIPPLLYLDRYRNEGTRTYSIHADYTEAQPPFRPDAEDAQFTLPVFELPRDQMRVYTAHPPDELSQTYLPPDSCLFCIHPQVLQQHPVEQRTEQWPILRG